MGLITFLSDFGYSDPYVAAVKARILTMDPAAQIVDISHNVTPFDIAQGSFILNAVFREFPENSVHIIALNSQNEPSTPFLALKLEGHYFVGSDNGIFGLISEHEPEQVVRLEEDKSRNYFPEKEVFAPAAVSLARGMPLEEVGLPYSGIKRMIGRKPRATKKQISGHVVHVDHYGNLITNIEKQVFGLLSKNKLFTVTFGRETLNKVHNHYYDADDGDIFAIFNSIGLLEIGISKGNASELLGLRYDSPVNVIFSE